MKRILLLTLLIGFTGTAQIGERNVESQSTLYGASGRNGGGVELRYINTDEGRYYFLLYNNEEYSFVDIRTLSFYTDDKDLESLYQFIKAGFFTVGIRRISVGEGTIAVGKIGNILQIYVTEANGMDSRFTLGKKHLERLFAKAE